MREYSTFLMTSLHCERAPTKEDVGPSTGGSGSFLTKVLSGTSEDFARIKEDYDDDDDGNDDNDDDDDDDEGN